MQRHPVYIAPNATVVGDVILEENVSVWYGAVLRGDNGRICVGKDSNIQDNCVLHGAVQLGSCVSVGHGAILHGCTVGDGAVVGMGAVILNGAHLGPGCLVGAGAVVTGKTDAPAGAVLVGNPARILRTLTPEQQLQHLENAQKYIVLADRQLKPSEW